MNTLPLHHDCGVILIGSGKLSAVNDHTVHELFRSNGAVLFRGFDVDRDEFRAFSTHLSREFVNHPNLSRTAYHDRTMTGVSPGTDHFFAHAEMAYTPMRPDAAWFYCERPAAKGGETTIFDGIEVLKCLNTRTRSTFEAKRILFEAVMTADMWRALVPDVVALERALAVHAGETFSYRLGAQDCLRTRFVADAIVKVRYGGHPAFCNSLLDIQEPRFEDGTAVPKSMLHDIVAATEQVCRPVRWQAGDVLFLDNSRFMHGRRAFDDQRRSMMVRFANVDF